MDEIIIAAGGTGGHVFPAQALHEFFIAKKLFSPTFITDSRGDMFVDKNNKFMKNKLVVPVAQFNKKKPLTIIKAIFSLISSTIILLKKYWQIKPKVVIGFGGYVTFPALFAAFILRVPIIIQESNAVMGRTNRFFAPYAAAIMVGFEGTMKIPHKYLNKVSVTGTPLRTALVEASMHKTEHKLYKDKLKLLIIGGSQAAKVLAEVVPTAILKLKPSLRNNLAVWQQVRPEQMESVRSKYNNEVAFHHIASFFSDDIASENSITNLMQQADLVIARAGASTICEIISLGKPAILVPFAAAMDNHQYYNALNLRNKEAAVMIVEDDKAVDKLCECLNALLSDGKYRSKLALNVKNTIHLRSTKAITKVVTLIIAAK
jgi:UDP-N-acetylglucosamine--N-acetylmuramyl-(pentapeptide) pyrophosphoryl-undecaprenol N-acetylglucosamine transferase